MSESEHSRETRSTRGTEFCAQWTAGTRDEAFVLSPSHLCLCAVSQRPFPAWTHRHSAVLCGTPSAKVGAFLALSSHTFRRHRPCTALRGIPLCPRSGYIPRFLPLPLANARHLRHSLSAFKSSPFAHQAGLPYTTAPFSVRNGLASACRTAGGLFLYRTCLKAARVQERALFCTGRRIASRL